MSPHDATAVEPGEELAAGSWSPDPVIGERLAQDRRLTIRSTFAGPLPAPGILAEYDRVFPGLAREIVDQWKAETQHRHEIVTSMRATDREEMVTYYAAERRGQTLSALAILGVLLVALVAIAYDRPVVGVTGLLAGSAAAIWAMRRRSAGPDVASSTEPGPSRVGLAAENDRRR